MKLLAALICTAAFALPAGDPAGFAMWKASELKAFTKSLSPKINEKKVATENLSAFGNYSLMMTHREGSGEAEWHDTKTDVIMVESGQATVIIGGELVNGATTAPNEKRAPSISGGSEKRVGPGDVLTVPPKTAHQFKLDPGKEVTFFVVKITQ